ncbi:MAG: alanine racemase, partial [Hungatella sp.]
MRPYARVYVDINLDAVIHNMEAMQQNLTPGTGMIGVVKTDAYGHGAVQIAQTIEPYVQGYAVASVEEAMILRQHGIVKPILVLGVTHESAYPELVEYDIRSAMFQLAHVKKLSAVAVAMGKTAKIHLALDTGMSRIGMEPDAASADMVKEMSALESIEIEGLFTHFSKADETDKTATFQQLKRYLDFVELLKQRGIEIPVKHCSNSAGILDLPETNLDAVRAGISIYGLYPSQEVNQTSVSLEPVMELKSCIVYKKTIRPGTEVSYGGTFVADREMVVATVPVGYGDGYPRNLS